MEQKETNQPKNVLQDSVSIREPNEVDTSNGSIKDTTLSNGNKDLESSIPSNEGASLKESKVIVIENNKIQTEKQVKEVLQADLESEVKELKDNIKKEGQEIKKDFLTIFGLFASFVTFLSIEVQIFKNRDNICELIGISSISLSFVMFFALVINDISKDKSEWSDFYKPTYVLNIAFFLMGIISLWLGGNNPTSRIGKIENQRTSDSIQINVQRLEIQNLKNRIETLDSLCKITAKFSK
jgi:hypothetical protein